LGRHLLEVVFEIVLAVCESASLTINTRACGY
jgi:hypothetical protein